MLTTIFLNLPMLFVTNLPLCQIVNTEDPNGIDVFGFIDKTINKIRRIGSVQMMSDKTINTISRIGSVQMMRENKHQETPTLFSKHFGMDGNACTV